MTDTEILDWLIAHNALAVGHFMGGDDDKVRTVGCGCCSDLIEDTPPAVVARVALE